MRFLRPTAGVLLVALVLTAAVALVVRPASPGPASPSAAPPFAGSTDPVLVGAGDIADCGREEDGLTADVLDAIDGTVYTTGDNAYESGTAAEYERCYGPTWGRHRERTMPVVGNHEYQTPAAAGHRAYWGDRAGPPDGFWYSRRLGSWRVVALDSNCTIVDCGPGSPQHRWLEAELATNASICTVAIWHHPRFSSGQHGDRGDVEPLWAAIVAGGVDVLLTGHDHDYERFAPISGVRQFVVGTGGAELRRFRSPHPSSEVRDASTHGVLALRLRTDGYDWRFAPAAGGSFSDTGSDRCA